MAPEDEACPSGGRNLFLDVLLPLEEKELLFKFLFVFRLALLPTCACNELFGRRLLGRRSLRMFVVGGGGTLLVVLVFSLFVLENMLLLLNRFC